MLLANTVIKAHSLTGDDYMSKMGTKHAALVCDPVQYLTHFERYRHLIGTLAEKYLVRAYVPVQVPGQLQLLRHLIS